MLATYKKLSCIVLIVLMSCHFHNKDINKLWFYTYSEDVSNADSTLTPTSFIYIDEDGTYTSNIGVFNYGKWIYTGQWLKLSDNKNHTTLVKVKSIIEKQLQLHFNNTKQVDNFESQPLSSFEKNPFSLQNNLWQIPPAKKESNLEIKKRLLNHLRFWEIYFTWASESNIQSIDLRSMPTLIKIYGNGFTLKSYNTLPEKWKSFFYDKIDCRKANDMMELLLSKNDIAWPHTDNKYTAFISVFQQLQIKLKALDVTSVIN